VTGTFYARKALIFIPLGLKQGLAGEWADLLMRHRLGLGLPTCFLQAWVFPGSVYTASLHLPRWQVNELGLKGAWMSLIWLSFCSHLTLWQGTEKPNDPKKKKIKTQQATLTGGKFLRTSEPKTQPAAPSQVNHQQKCTKKPWGGQGWGHISHLIRNNRWLESHGLTLLYFFHHWYFASAHYIFFSKIRFKMESNRPHQAVLGYR
jgi:hypothetical protein